MDIRDLKLFLHLCESQHFGTTAKSLYLSPSTLSRQIQRLEDTLGQPLFIRDNRSVQITDAGLQFKQFAQQTLANYQQLYQQLNSTQQIIGELRLFCSVTAAYSHLPEILDRFRLTYPAVEIKLSTGDAADAINKIVNNEADLAIAGQPKKLPTSVEFIQIGEIEMALFMPKHHTKFSNHLYGKIPDWQKIPFILPEHGPCREQIDRWFKQQKLTNPLIYVTVAGHEAIVSLVALGCGVALLPKVVVENSPEQIRERVIAWSDSLMPPFDIGVCVQRKRLSESIIAAFWQLLK